MHGLISVIEELLSVLVSLTIEGDVGFLWVTCTIRLLY